MQKLKKILGNHIGGSFQRILKVKEKVKKDVDKFTLW